MYVGIKYVYKLHIVKLRISYYSLSIIRMLKSRRMRWAENVARMSRLPITAVPNLFSLPYRLISLFIYECPLSSLPPPIPQKSLFLIF
jgi:hypothetical protein